MRRHPLALALALAPALAAPLGAPALARAETATGGAYSVEAKAATAHPGVPSAATVVITPGKGYHFNKECRTTLKLDPVSDDEAPALLSAKDAGVKVEDSGASFEVRFTARTAGPKDMTGMLSFAVCTASTCEPRKHPVTLHIDVK